MTSRFSSFKIAALLAMLVLSAFNFGAAAQTSKAAAAGSTIVQNGESVASTVSRAKTVGKSFKNLFGKRKIKQNRSEPSESASQTEQNAIKPSSPVPTADRSNDDIRRDNILNGGRNRSLLTEDLDDDDGNSANTGDNEVRIINRQIRPRVVKIE